MAKRFGRAAGLAAILILLGVSPLRAGMDEANEAFERGDMKAAFVEFLAEAEQGNAIAQYNVALMYAEGLGTKKLPDEAVRWYRMAAEQGHADAQFELSEMLYWGDEVPADLAESAHWTRLAAEQGHAEAQFALGSMYYSGEGVPVDLNESAHWTRMAGEQGLADAQYEMGWMYLLGEGVDVDIAESIRWTELAANQGHVEAQYDMGDIYATGDGVVADREEAMRWYGLAAEQGHQEAAARLAEMTGAQGPVDPAVVGLWEIYIPNGQNWWRWTLDIKTDGTYVFEQDGVVGHSGTIEAKDGAWRLTSQTDDWTDGGTYQMPNNDTFNLTGKLGPGSWRRVAP
jgi:TPR repeat protein